MKADELSLDRVGQNQRSSKLLEGDKIPSGITDTDELSSDRVGQSQRSFNKGDKIPSGIMDTDELSSDRVGQSQRSSKLLEEDKIPSGIMDTDELSSDRVGQSQRSSKLLEVNKMPSTTMECIECDVCKSNSDDQTTKLPTASKCCIECQQNLCVRCAIDHRRQKLLKDHHIVQIFCQVENNAAESSQPNAKSTVQQNPCHHSANVASVCLSTTQSQHQTSGIDVMTQITAEKDRLEKYEAEMSNYIDQLLNGQEDINTLEDNITSMIHKKYSECLARLESDKKCLLGQLYSRKEKELSKNETRLQEAINYLKKITDRKKNLEEILLKGTVDGNDESTKSLLLHIHFPQPIASLANVKFHECSNWVGIDNFIGRLEGPLEISKTQTEPTLTSYRYMKFLREVHSRTTDAKRIQWRMTILDDREIRNLYDLDRLNLVQNDLKLRHGDKKRDELHVKHVKMANNLLEVTRPISEASSNTMENYLNELQCNTERLWNTMQFHIYYQNSENGLTPLGFPNFGNTCYFNSVLQCLLQTVLLPFELTVNLYGLENVFYFKKEIYCLSKAFMELSSRYNDYEHRKGALKTLYNKFTAEVQRFNNQSQHDSHDLLIHFLDKLRVEERNARGIPSAGPDSQKMLTTIDRIFGGQFITVYTCQRCEEHYAIREPFLDISIPLCMLTPDEQKTEENKSKPTAASEFKLLPGSASKAAWYPANDNDTGLESFEANVQQRMLADVGNYEETHFSPETNLFPSSPADDGRKDSTKREVIKSMLQTIAVDSSAEPEARNRLLGLFSPSKPSVSHCLKYFTRTEVIKDEYMCRNCQKPESDELVMTSATKRTLISSPPAILVLHLKRFEQTPIGFVKRDGMILYDELLDLGPFCSSSAQRIDPEEENVWYSLYAVVVHGGFFLSQGHYVAYVKKRDASRQIDEQLREKFLQKNVGERDKVPNDDDLEAMEKRKSVKKKEKSTPVHPIPDKWFCISDDDARPCDAKKALDQKAFLLFYERIPCTGHKRTAV